MQDYIVELPLRTIHLQMQDKTPTHLETSGLTAYLDLTRGVVGNETVAGTIPARPWRFTIHIQ